MSKTSDMVEVLNHTQKQGLKKICGGKLMAAPQANRKKAWFRTGTDVHWKTVVALHGYDLVEMDQWPGGVIAKPTAFGKRVAAAL